MKSIVLLLIISIFSFAEAAEVIKLGNIVTYGGDEIEDFAITKTEAVAYSVTDGWTLSSRGCYAKKVRTGQGFPYRYNYTALKASEEIITSVNGKEISLLAIESAIAKAKEDLRKKAAFFCSKSEGLGIQIEVKTETQTLKTYLSLGQDEKGLYVEKPWGNEYVKDARIDIVPLPL